MSKSIVALATVLSFAVYGCENAPLGPQQDAPAPAFNHGSPHGGGGGGGGGGKDGSSSFDITVTGGVTGSAQGIKLGRDNKNKIIMPAPAGGGWAWNLTATQAVADLERTNPGASDLCWFVPADMSDDFKQTLVGHLVIDLQETGSLTVNKPDARGHLGWVNDVDPWVRIGFNVQEDVPEHRPLVDDNGSGVDWNDASGTRQFRYNPDGDDGGIVRTVMVINPEAQGEQQLGELKCWVQDTILVVLSPAAS
ncbi:MAG TPA: hypothetical protein VK837_05265 [Longimicrobiales bacterium]|nr:hypothetical protein [Longimicrobiales bacterium]